MSYAAPSDILARYDARRLGDLCQDENVRVTPTGLLTDPNLQAALDDASGMIDAAIQRGQRYTPQDISNILAATSGQPLYNSLKLLVRLCCDLAFGLLVGRRGYNATDTAAQAPRYVEAMRLLERIENGEWIFLTTGALGAGVPQPTVVLSQNVNLISSLTRIFGYLGVGPGPNYPLYSPFNRGN